MDIPIEHEAFRTRRLVVRTAGFWKGPQVLIDGALAGGKRLKYEVHDDAGRPRTAVLKATFLDPIPRLQIDDEPVIALARPLAWYEWAWTGLPMLLIFAGGALGALFGMLAVWTNTRIFRSDHGVLSKYLLSALVSGSAVLLFVLGATALELAINGK